VEDFIGRRLHHHHAISRNRCVVMSMIPTNQDALLRRKQVADALTEAGYPVTRATLATKATRGGGPPFRLFGRTPLYRWADALRWAEGRLTPPRRSTSEADVERRAA
jgi:hypothetical protein